MPPNFIDRRAATGRPVGPPRPQQQRPSAPRAPINRAPAPQGPRVPGNVPIIGARPSAPEPPPADWLRSDDLVPLEAIFGLGCPRCGEPVEWRAEADGLVTQVTGEHLAKGCGVQFAATVQRVRIDVMDESGNKLVERNGQLYYPKAPPQPPAPGPRRARLRHDGGSWVSLGYAGPEETASELFTDVPQDDQGEDDAQQGSQGASAPMFEEEP